MLVHDHSCRAPEHHMASHHLPERHAERVEVRPNVNADSGELLGTGKLRRTGKASTHRDCGLRSWFIDWLGQPKVDDFGGDRASLLQAYHDVAWFDIPVNQLLFVYRSQSGGDLGRYFQRQVYLQTT